MQILAYRWKNFHLLNSSTENQQRRSICEELAAVGYFEREFSFIRSSLLKDQSVLAIPDNASIIIIDKITTLEQTVIQRLRWAAGANPLVQDVLMKFENQQKQRTNEINVRKNSIKLFCSSLNSTF